MSPQRRRYKAQGAASGPFPDQALQRRIGAFGAKLFSRLDGVSATAELVRKAVQRSHQRPAPPGETKLSAYDDELAFVFKHPHCRATGVFLAGRRIRARCMPPFEARIALAERAFHHLRFIREQGASLDSLILVSQIAFDVTAMNRVDVRHPPVCDEPGFLDPGTAYTRTQQFAEAARRTSAHAIQYTSVRDIAGGANLALFDYRRLASSRLDRHRVKDWFLRTTDGVTAQAQTTGREYFALRFTPEGKPF